MPGLCEKGASARTTVSGTRPYFTDSLAWWASAAAYRSEPGGHTGVAVGRRDDVVLATEFSLPTISGAARRR